MPQQTYGFTDTVSILVASTIDAKLNIDKTDYQKFLLFLYNEDPQFFITKHVAPTPSMILEYVTHCLEQRDNAWYLYVWTLFSPTGKKDDTVTILLEIKLEIVVNYFVGKLGKCREQIRGIAFYNQYPDQFNKQLLDLEENFCRISEYFGKIKKCHNDFYLDSKKKLAEKLYEWLPDSVIDDLVDLKNEKKNQHWPVFL